MEVGRITARIDGEVADFERKMRGAQRTFEGTATNMGSSAARVTRTVNVAFDGVDKAAKRSVPSVNALRGAMTSLAANAANAAPGVGQLTSVLGSMALGSTMMIGVLGGLAAVGFAWDAMTKKARESKKVVDEHIASLEKLAKKQAQGILGEVPEQTASAALRMAEIQSKITEINNLIAQGGESKYIASGRAAADVVKLQKEWDRLFKLMKAGQAESDRILDETVIDAATESLRRYKQEWEEVARVMRMAAPLLGQALPPIGDVRGGPRAPQPRAPTLLPSGMGPPQMLNWQYSPPAPPVSFLKDLGESIKGMLDPKMLLTGLVTGGISTGISALTSFVGGILTAGKAARELARQMETAQRELLASFRDTVAGLRAQLAGPDAAAMFDAVSRIREQFKQFSKQFELGGWDLPQLPNIQAVIKWLEEAIRTSGAALSPTALAALKEILERARLEEELNKLADATNKVTSSLVNVPQGFKIALARFNATEGLMGPGPNIPGHPIRGGGPVFTGDITVMANDPQEFLAKLETEVIRKQARGGATLMLSYS